MPALSPEAVERYLSSLFGHPVRVGRLSLLGGQADALAAKGYGYGTPVLVEYAGGDGAGRVVLETQSPGPYGHEHMADRAQMLLWDRTAYNRLPRHVRAVDVGSFGAGGELRSLGDVEELFLLAEYVEGTSYIRDLVRIADTGRLDDLDLARIDALADYLAGIHTVHGPDPGLYVRRIRELLGHGECIMGIVDGYPPGHGFLTPSFLEGIERSCLGWRWRLKERVHRLRQVHGDFHPFNILFREGTDFRVLDRSRGEWGEPADDVTALAINFLFLSLQRHGRLRGPMETLLHRFWDRYIDRTGDRELPEVVAPFFAFRGLVVASPVWYPSLPEDVRRRIFAFVEGVLAAESFAPSRVNDWARG